MAYVLHRRIRLHPGNCRQILLQLIDALNYPVFILVIHTQALKIYLRRIQTAPLDVAFGLIQDFQHVGTAAVAHGKLQVGDHMARDPVLKQIRQRIPHTEGHIVL